MSLFSNWSLQLSFNKINLNILSISHGFAAFTPTNSYYYVSDAGLSKIFILNESWWYVSSKTFLQPTYFTTIGSSLYATGETNIWKLDQNLNTLIQYNATGTPIYRGIYINSTNNLIYIAPLALRVIHVFDLNLSLSHTFSTTIYAPWSIANYNNQMYVGTSTGKILVIVNELIYHTFNGCNGVATTLTSILFDNCGYMATSCYNNQLYLYYPNGTYFSQPMTTPSRNYYIGYDSNGHLIHISGTRISIYN
jgi:hypothetical protein